MPARSAIYLDSNAGAPLLLEVKQALLPFLELEDAKKTQLSNPSSPHEFGRRAKAALSHARIQVARSLGAEPEKILFTSSGTEASQTAIRAMLESRLLNQQPVHWITTRVEHDATLQMVTWLEARGGRVSYLPHDSQGRPRIEALRDLLTPDTALVSVIWVNNETGVITDVAALAEICRACAVPLHLDGAQAWGKLPIALSELDADFVSFSGHKLGALPGMGVLYAKHRLADSARLFPGKQERGLRAGTENLLGAVAMGAAAATLNPDAFAKQLVLVRDRLAQEILQRLPEFSVNGADAPRVANTLSLSWCGQAGLFPAGLIPALDMAGFCVSAGSACGSGSPEPSHVLSALGRTRDQGLSSIRISLTRGQEWDRVSPFVDALERVVQRAKEFA